MKPNKPAENATAKAGVEIFTNSGPLTERIVAALKGCVLLLDDVCTNRTQRTAIDAAQELIREYGHAAEAAKMAKVIEIDGADNARSGDPLHWRAVGRSVHFRSVTVADLIYDADGLATKRAEMIAEFFRNSKGGAK